MSQCLIFQLLDEHTGGDKDLGAEPEDIGSTGNGNDAAEPIVVVQTEAHEHRHHSDGYGVWYPGALDIGILYATSYVVSSHKDG